MFAGLLPLNTNGYPLKNDAWKLGWLPLYIYIHGGFSGEEFVRFNMTGWKIMENQPFESMYFLLKIILRIVVESQVTGVLEIQKNPTKNQVIHPSPSISLSLYIYIEIFSCIYLWEGPIRWFLEDR